MTRGLLLLVSLFLFALTAYTRPVTSFNNNLAIEEYAAEYLDSLEKISAFDNDDAFSDAYTEPDESLTMDFVDSVREERRKRAIKRGDSNLTAIERRNRMEKKREKDMRIFVLLFLLAIAVFYIWISNKHRKIDQQWKQGLIPENYKFSMDHLMEAYLRLAGLMLRTDRESFKEKVRYLHQYFLRKFPNSDVDFNEVLKLSLQHPVKQELAANWLKRNLSKPNRIQVIYFLAGLSVIDGDLNPREKSIITRFAEQLGVSKKELDSVLGMYARYEWQNRRNEESERSRKYAKSRSQRELEQCSKILGVSISAKMDEIKKAYRNLVKLHHPDLFANQSKEQQELAKERFIIVQSAYEYLEKVK